MRKTLLLLSALPVSVILFNFVQGAVDYGFGTAVLRTKGYPGFEFANLDPSSRAHFRTGGCMLMGYEPLTQTPYNVAVQALALLLGPMPGSYDGPYPDEADAWRRVEVEGEALSLDPSLEEIERLTGSASVSVLYHSFEPHRYLRGPLESHRLRGLVLEERLLIVAGANDADPSAYLVLIDLEKGERVARYQLRNPGYVRGSTGEPSGL